MCWVYEVCIRKRLKSGLGMMSARSKMFIGGWKMWEVEIVMNGMMFCWSLPRMLLWHQYWSNVTCNLLMVSLINYGLGGENWTNFIHLKSHTPKHLFNTHVRKNNNNLTKNDWTRDFWKYKIQTNYSKVHNIFLVKVCLMFNFFIFKFFSFIYYR